jgi:hypothetical protein
VCGCGCVWVFVGVGVCSIKRSAQKAHTVSSGLANCVWVLVLCVCERLVKFGYVGKATYYLHPCCSAAAS